MTPGLLLALALSQPWPGLEVRQNGARLSRTHNQYILDCRSPLVCTNTKDVLRLTATTPTPTTLACTAACVSDAEISDVSGAKVSGAVASATTAGALASNPTACESGQFVTDMAADGTLTCATPAGGPGGSGAPVDGGYLVWATAGSTNERVLAAAGYITLDAGAASLLSVGWQHGATCSAGQALTSSGVTGLACTSTLTASDVACAGTCVADAEIAAVAGVKVSGSVANADNAALAAALAADPADCAGSFFAHTISADGTLTCSQVRSQDIDGVIAISKGGTTETASTEDAVLVGAGTADWAPKVLPSCSNATTSKLLYDTATNTFSCGTDQTGGGGGGEVLARVSADVTNSTTAFADVTGLTFSVLTGTTYALHCNLTYTTAATTTALQLSTNGPTASAIDYYVFTNTTATAKHDAVQVAYNTATNPATGGGTVRLGARVDGTFVFTANGTLAVRFRSEINASAVVVKRGSWCSLSVVP